MDTLPIADVLLVEDSPADAEMTLTTLRAQRTDSSVEWVRDGEIALDYLYCQGISLTRQAVLPKLVLLDLKLPKVDGLEVLRRMKQDGLLRAVPVVVLTSSATEEDMVRCYALGVNSYVVKPVSFDQFHLEIGKLGIYWLLVNKTHYAR